MVIFKDTKSRLFLFFIITTLITYVYPYGLSLSMFQRQNHDSVSVETLDLEGIQKRGKLIALTDNGSTSFYIYKGDSMGYEYELLDAFTKEMGLKLEMRVAKNMNAIFEQLNNGSVDIIAANLTVTKERLNSVNFTEHLLLARQVLIQRKPKGWENMTSKELDTKLIRNTIDLNGKRIYVRKASSFYTRLTHLSEEIGGKINIIEVPGENDTETLISKVAKGEIDYTVADENVALSNQTYYSNIDIAMAISFPQKIAWATRKQSSALTKKLNEWILKRKNSNENLVIYNKYFKTPKKSDRGNTRQYISSGGSLTSQYDDLIKTYSKKIDWDWELLASMIYQESHFSPTARSWAGANGLMQLMPGTAKRYGLDTIDATAEQSLKAGTDYLVDLDKYWRGYISDKQERIKFILASYNVGLGHVIDARNLAIKHGKNKNIWYNNVESMILQKSNPMVYTDPIVKCGYCRGQETFIYVKEILSRYTFYKNNHLSTDALVKN
ncbi:MAG: hypothetical protein A3F72_03565 [Bacteroidetes bacterium RIFCSPLOWO2_12_FULL_35_15]|nr:MAG: hypothetical protein A3F72_03565 [Bacteroidetes bacterium RIFCSPLOWO2_12_FULL_35_15]